MRFWGFSFEERAQRLLRQVFGQRTDLSDTVHAAMLYGAKRPCGLLEYTYGRFADLVRAQISNGISTRIHVPVRYYLATLVE